MIIGGFGSLGGTVIAAMMIGLLEQADYPWEDLDLDASGILDHVDTVTTVHYRLDLFPGGDAVVYDAEAVVTLDTTMRADSEQYATLLQAFDRDTAMHRFLDASGRELDLPATGALAGVAARDLLDVAVRESRDYFIVPHRLASGEERTVEIHSTSSSAFETVADRHTRPTEPARCTMISSHTGPRAGSWR